MDATQSTPRRLVRYSSAGRVAGVCAGIAEYLDTDVTLVRLAWVVLSIVPGAFLGGLLAYLAAWIVTRTVGSLIGPEATQPAEAGFGDIVSTAFEAAIVVGALLMLRRRRLSGPNPVEAHWSEVAKALAAIGITLLTVLALFSTVGGSPFVSHVG